MPESCCITLDLPPRQLFHVTGCFFLSRTVCARNTCSPNGVPQQRHVQSDNRQLHCGPVCHFGYGCQWHSNLVLGFHFMYPVPGGIVLPESCIGAVGLSSWYFQQYHGGHCLFNVPARHVHFCDGDATVVVDVYNRRCVWNVQWHLRRWTTSAQSRVVDWPVGASITNCVMHSCSPVPEQQCGLGVYPLPCWR